MILLVARTTVASDNTCGSHDRSRRKTATAPEIRELTLNNHVIIVPIFHSAGQHLVISSDERPINAVHVFD
jgi:hypothetical protein